MNLIQEAIEAAATQDLCGNHNSADLLRRLARELEAERSSNEYRLNEIKGTFEDFLDFPCLALRERHSEAIRHAIAINAKRREAGE